MTWLPTPGPALPTDSGAWPSAICLPPRSARHSRASSTATVVDTAAMALTTGAGHPSPAAAPAPALVVLPIDVPDAPLKLAGKCGPATPCMSLSCSPGIDSLLGLAGQLGEGWDAYADCRTVPAMMAGADGDEGECCETTAAAPVLEDAQAQGAMFDMDADWADEPEPAAAAAASAASSRRHSYSHHHQSPLDPGALAYTSMGKPQPWAVRQPGLYDSLRAQIRAIDDDDNELYPS